MQMDTTSEELLPCPFCGETAERIGMTETQIRCSNDQCITRGAFNFYNHRADAIAAWNTRAVNAYPALVEALEYCQRMFRLDLFREIDSDGPDFNQAIFDTSERVDAALALSARGDGS